MNILYTGQSALRSICTTGYNSAYVTPWYSSQAATARDVEQIFTEQSDPMPQTDDWENFILPITASDYVAARFRIYITAINTTFAGISMPSPLYRMCTSAGELSATFPRDGYNIERGYTSTSMPWPTAGKYGLRIIESSHSNSANSARVVASAESPWIPMNQMAGTETGLCSACVGCRANPFFINTWGIYSDDYEWRSAFLEGMFTALPESAAISGQVQFARTGADWGYQVSDMLVR